jgi:hypothetical protein
MGRDLKRTRRTISERGRSLFFPVSIEKGGKDEGAGDKDLYKIPL